MFRKCVNRIIASVMAALLLLTAIPLSMLALATEFTPENVFRTDLVNTTSVVKKISSGAVSDHGQFNGAGAISVLNDGDTVTLKDAYGANDWGSYSGVVFELGDEYYCADLNIYAGLTAYPDTYMVYASTNFEDLHTSASLVAENITCAGAKEKVSLNRNVRYVAVFLTDYTYNGRIAEIELWTGDKSVEQPTFVSENILQSKVEAASGILYDTQTGGVAANDKFDQNGAIVAVTDGNTDAHTDVYGMSQTKKVGVLFTLNDSYYCKKVTLFSGFEKYPDQYSVYATDNLDLLYSSESQVAKGIICNGEATDIMLNKSIKYLAIIFDSDGGRVKEYQLWTAEDHSTPPFKTENVLQTAINGITPVIKNQSTGIVSSHNQFNGKGAASAAVDGDTKTFTDAYGANDWNHYSGVVYDLSASFYCGNIKIFSGFEAYPDYYDVYASNSLSTLYSDNNKVASNLKCTGETSIDLNRDVKYVAFFLTDYKYNGRVAEFQLWTAENQSGGGEDGEPDKATKVLTIGNSFAENASGFATEIAAAQGHNLMFAYLKYPSCTIEQHYDNAVKSNAVYKFAYTSYNGAVNRTTIKDGITSHATIEEALRYTDWDVIVLQQGSTASYTYSTYAKTADLIAYVKSICPTVEIKVHETWSWATWATDGNPDNNFKHIEDCYHQMAEENGSLKIIPTGRAFEFARREGIKLNDSDNQHANSYGQYLAGACYVAAIFNEDIAQNTFGDDHIYFADVDMNILRTSVMNAVNFKYDPNTNWDYADGEEQKPDVSDPDSTNFIRRHFSSFSAVMQDVKNGTFAEGDRFLSNNSNGAMIAIDGDIKNHFDVYGALLWEYPKNIGLSYTLDASYKVDSATIVAGSAERPATYSVYASNTIANLYNSSSRVAENITCSGSPVTVPVGKEIQYVAFIMTGYFYNDDGNETSWVMEFDLSGSDTPIAKEEIIWPEIASGSNILNGTKASEIIAPGGDYNGTKEFDYKFMDQQTESDLKYLTDGNLEKHYDIWSLAENDKPGVLYDLGAYYDISQLRIWAGAYNSQLLAVNGCKIYASDSLENLYKTKNLAFSYNNPNDTTGQMAVNVELSKVRYIAFILTNTIDGGWRMREFAAYGTRSADQTAAVEQKSIIEGIDAEYYGVATDNLADPIYMGASNFVKALTDGKRDAVEFWGGSDVAKSKFVFIFDLYENYDLTGIDIYASADSIEDDSGIHKGIRSAKVYASRKFDTLFTEAPITVKEDYTNDKIADEESFYSTDAKSDWKMARYVAFVFTIGDSRYGACRLEELKVFGTLSATQDVEEEEAKLPQYIDIKADNGIVARVFALNGKDDLSKLGVSLKANESTESDTLRFVNDSLSGYTASIIYDISVVNPSGQKVDLDGRLIRLSIPENGKSNKIACVDDFGAEIVSNGILNGCLTVETETLRDYALVSSGNPASSKNGTASEINWLMILTISLGVLAGIGIGTSVLFGIRNRK